MLKRFFSTGKRILQLESEINSLQRENAMLAQQNNSMREGMRRCVSCDYRLEIKRQQDQS
ncbi:MAG: hypothetical protein V7742_16205 [Halioglobus sp.]